MHRVLRMAVFSLLCLAPLGGSAQTATVSTTPVGYITLNIAAGTGTTSELTPLSLPLFGNCSITGQSTGVITGVTANSISNSSAGWTASALSGTASPYLIQITSGSATGRLFLISTATANTATTVFLDREDSAQVDLTTLGIVTGSSGDTYSIYPCDTLQSVFGQGSTVVSSTTVLGGANSTVSDIVQFVVNGAWQQYYYNTNKGHWVFIGPLTLSDNTPIRPDAGVIYLRRAASPLTLSVSGQVPSVQRQTVIANNGMTVLSSFWPVATTLGSSGITSIPGWVSGTSSVGADVVQLSVQGAWQRYYYNGSHWILIGPRTPSDSDVIPVGGTIILLKNGSNTGVSPLTQALPYTL